jgi:hypothetical protein
MGSLAALQPLCRWWFCSESVAPGARGGSCLHINPPPSQPATFVRYRSMCFVSAPCISQWLLILGLLCPWCLASFGTWQVPSHWHLCSVNTLLIGAAITSYVEWSFHRSAIPPQGFLPLGGVGWREAVEPGCAPRCHYQFQGRSSCPVKLWSALLFTTFSPPFGERPSDGGYHRIGAATRGGARVQWQLFYQRVCCLMESQARVVFHLGS